MITAPIPMPSTVPMGPAMGRKVLPGMTKEPQPTAQPKASAHAPRGDRYFVSPLFSALIDKSEFHPLQTQLILTRYGKSKK